MVAFALRSFASPLTVFLRITVLPGALVLSSNISGIGITCQSVRSDMPEGVEIITEQPQGFHAASDATGNATEKKSSPSLLRSRYQGCHAALIINGWQFQV